MRSYTLDTTAAQQANQNSYIDQTGKYIGAFIVAKAVTSRSGTEGIEFSFKAQDGRQANYLTLWTFNSQGEALYGFKVLNALMTVMGVKELHPKKGSAAKPDGTREEAIAYPDLHNKPVGIVLQKEFYFKDNGEEGYKFNIFAPFQAGTELMAKELLDNKTQPQALASIISSLKDKPAPAQQSRGGQTGNAYQAPAQNGSQPADPFGSDFGNF